MLILYLWAFNKELAEYHSSGFHNFEVAKGVSQNLWTSRP